MYHNTDKSKINYDKVDETAIDSLKKAGKIAAEALHYGKDLVKHGAKVVDVIDEIEKKITQLGGGFAFPTITYPTIQG